MNEITVVSLGPGPRAYLTLGAVDTLKQAKKIILRTRIACDAADYLREIGLSFDTLDALHEACEDSFAQVAEILALPLPTVKSRFLYGLEKLRRGMKN